jgi:hypothetical protein
MIKRKNTNKTNVYEYNMTGKEINPNDVLCGRGGLTNSHAGNKRFRDVVAEYQLEYLKARKNDKKGIARKIVSHIGDNGGRFLQRGTSSNVWSIASEKRALEKTSQALREGLDVRHKALRPRKLVRKRDRNFSRVDSRMRTKNNIAKGIVIDSPETIQDLHQDVPDLVNDESSTTSFEPIFTFFPQTIMNPGGTISEKDCHSVWQI